MPKTVLEADAQQAIGEMGAFAQSLFNGSAAVTQIQQACGTFSATGKQLTATIAGLNSSGKQFEATFKNTKNGVKLLGGEVSSTGKLVRDAKRDLDAFNNSARFIKVRGQVSSNLARSGKLKDVNDDQKNSVDSKVNQIATIASKGAEGFKSYLGAINAYNTGFVANLSRDEAQMLLLFKQIDSIGSKSRAKALAGANAVNPAKNAANALAARSQIERHLTNTGGLRNLNADQLAGVGERINQVVAIAGRGSAGFKAFQDAVIAMSTGVTGNLSQMAQRVYSIFTRIENTTSKAAAKVKADADKIAATTVNKAAGARIVGDLQRDNTAKFGGLDPAAQERVRSQFARLQGLFNKGLSDAGYQRSLKAFETGVTTNLSRVEEAARHHIARINIELNNVGKSDSLGKLGTAARQAVIGLLTLKAIDTITDSIKNFLSAAGDFQIQIGLLRTISQDANISFSEWATGIQAVSAELGRPTAEVAAAAYDLLSNQITKGIDTFETLHKIGRFANATNASLTSSVNLVSSAIQSFGLDATDTQRTLSKLFTTIDIGRVTVDGLKDSYGRAALPAKALGVSEDELNASIATISQTGIGEQQTLTLITNVFHKLINPTKELQGLYDKLGVSSGEMFIKTHGLVGALRILQKETGGSVTELGKFFNEIRGEQGITNLIKRLATFEATLKEYKSPTSSLKGAQIEIEETSGLKFKQQLEEINNYLTDFKSKALDAFISVTDALGGLANMIKAIGPYIQVLGAVVAGAFAVKGLEFAIKGVFELAKALKVASIAGIALGKAVPWLALAAGAYLLYRRVAETEERYKEFAKNREAEEKKSGDAQTELVKAAIDKQTELRKQAVDTQRGIVLKGVAAEKAGLKTIGEGQTDTLKDLNSSLKESFEIMHSGLRKGIDTLKQIQNEAGNVRKKVMEDRKTLGPRVKDMEYSRDLLRNKLNNQNGQGRDRSKELLYKRLADLGAMQKKAKTLDDALAISDKRLALAEAAGQETVPKPIIDLHSGQQVGNYDVLKYPNIEKTINKILDERVAINATLLTQADEMSKKASAELLIKEQQYKKLERVAGELAKFDPKKYKTADEAKAGYNKLRGAYDNQAGIAGVVADRPGDTLNRAEADVARRKAAGEAIKAHFGGVSNILETQSSEEAATKRGEDATKTYDSDKIEAIGRNRKSAAEIKKNAQLRAYGKINELNDLETGSSTIGRMLNLQSPTLYKGMTKHFIDQTRDFVGMGQPGAALGSIRSAREHADRTGQLGNEISKDSKGNVVVLREWLNEIEKLIQKQNEARGKEDDLSAALLKSDTEAKSRAEKYVELNTQSNEAMKTLTALGVTNGAEFDKARDKAESLRAELKGLDEEAKAAMRSLMDTAAELGPITDESTKGNAATKAATALPDEPTHESIGGVVYRATGGLTDAFMSGAYAKGTDKIPVMMAHGEMVVNAQSTARFMPQLMAINAGFDPSHSNQHGSGNQYSFGDMHIHVKGGDNPTQTSREIVSGIKRQMRRGALTL